MLFLVFIKHFPESIKSTQCKLIADDSHLYKVIGIQEDSDLLQLDLTALETWEETWQMSFNASKCIVLRIAPRNKILQSAYKLHGYKLYSEEASSYLGVTITDNLPWNKHTNNITNKGNTSLGFIRRNLRECTVPVKAAMVQLWYEHHWSTHQHSGIHRARPTSNILSQYSAELPGIRM